MLKNEIIQELNEDWQNRFPALETWFPVDTRLSAYRSDQTWALVIETFVFNQQRVGGECPSTMVYCFGNNLPQAPGLCYPELHVTGDGPSGPLFEPFSYFVSPSAADMTIRGKVVPITTDPAKYAAAGIDLEEPPSILGYELLRLIAPAHRRLFFATEREIAERIGEELPLLLRLSEWRHPRMFEMPSETESFQLIAEAIAKNDPSLCQPTEPPNTHWSNWPMAGEV